MEVDGQMMFGSLSVSKFDNFRQAHLSKKTLLLHVPLIFKHQKWKPELIVGRALWCWTVDQQNIIFVCVI